ncbi:MAG: tRNA lysidine(34) synthetase TilS [Deltaproteobacteria bacterium]|nr:tRNA lysidine(34) synthetase TilS [Deltaproteobacteria bacterium]
MDQPRAFEQAVLGTIRKHRAIAPRDRVLVAVSGGADSTALLAVLDALVRRGALAATLAVAHLNHRMRGAASDRDAAFVAGLAARLGLPCFSGTSDALAGVRANREAAARAARHAFLQRAGGEWNASRIALAHTRDDQAETLLMRLARGAGPSALGGMRVVRGDGVVRPLLEQPRSSCVAYLRARGQEWMEDESNSDERYFRNRVRRRLLPALEAELGIDVRPRLARLAEQLRQESALAEKGIDGLLRGATDDMALSIDLLHAAGVGAPRLVHAWLARAGVRASERQVATVVRIAAGHDPSAEVVFGGGRRVVRRYGDLRLAPAFDPRPVPGAAAQLDVPGAAVQLEVPGRARIPGWTVRAEVAAWPGATSPDDEPAEVRSCFDGDDLVTPLWVRRPQPGDRVRLPHGRRKLADILIDAKIPRHERAGLVVVGGGADVLWVPGVVRSVVASASAATRRCVILCAERSGTERGTETRGSCSR